MISRGRHGARRLLLQALYQNQIAGHSCDELQTQFAADPGFASVDSEYFNTMLSAILADCEGLDARLQVAADRPIEQLDPVERSVLWIGLMELEARTDIPPRVVIDEAVELAKEFGAQDSYRYVNAILDAVSTELR